MNYNSLALYLNSARLRNDSLAAFYKRITTKFAWVGRVKLNNHVFPWPNGIGLFYFILTVSWSVLALYDISLYYFFIVISFRYLILICVQKQKFYMLVFVMFVFILQLVQLVQLLLLFLSQ